MRIFLIWNDYSEMLASCPTVIAVSLLQIRCPEHRKKQNQPRELG